MHAAGVLKDHFLSHAGATMGEKMDYTSLGFLTMHTYMIKSHVGTFG